MRGFQTTNTSFSSNQTCSFGLKPHQKVKGGEMLWQEEWEVAEENARKTVAVEE